MPTALAFGRAGAQLVLCDVNATGVAERAKEFQALGLDARPAAGDLTEPDIARLGGGDGACGATAASTP